MTSKIKKTYFFGINSLYKTMGAFFVLMWAIASSCGGSKPENSSGGDTLSTTNTTVANTATSPPGQALIAKYDCAGCHQPLNKVVGPSYADIGKKYNPNAENISKLASTIINGVAAGKGAWGQLPMPAHPQLSKADAEEMVKYILSVK